MKKLNTRGKNIFGEKIYTLASFCFFVFMMCFKLMNSSLWGDEWVEYFYSQAKIMNGDLYNNIISTFQPPLYNFIMHFWLKISQSILWFRLFNVIIGFICAIFIYLSIKILYDNRIASLVIALWAVCYQWIYCIQECSEYSLMLMFLSGSLFFYIICCESFKYLSMIFFILFSVLAIYSQYGAVFVAVPLLLLLYIRIVFSKKENVQKKIIINLAYLFSLIAFAMPLYIFFVRKQMENNGISDNAVKLSGGILREIPFKLGQVIGYFYNICPDDIWDVVCAIASVMIISLIIVIIFYKSTSWIKKSVLIAFLMGYIAHFVLVQMHIYAMIHPGMSGGFYIRYSYFYIPICCLALPIIYKESSIDKMRIIKCIVCILIICTSVVSFLDLKENWHKALDKEFMEIWSENEGWNDYTILYGVNYGFYYHVKELDNYQEEYLDKVLTKVDNNNLPSSFWAWRINWGGDGWQETIDKANSLGYSVTIYEDSGYSGQLAFCKLEN